MRPLRLTLPPVVRCLLAVSILLVVAGLGMPQAREAGEGRPEKITPGARFDLLAAETVDQILKTWPTLATQEGAHIYDDRLEEGSETWAVASAEAFRLFGKDLRKIDEGRLRPDQKVDRELLLASTGALAMESAALRTWESDPGLYGRIATMGVSSLVGRGTAADAVRMRAIIARERRIPGLLDRGRRQLQKPGRDATEQAQREMAAFFAFFRNDVPLAFAAVKDKRVRFEFEESHRDLIDALRRWNEFLADDLLPRARTDTSLRLGADGLQKWVHSHDLIDASPDALSRAISQDLRQAQEAARIQAPHIRQDASVVDALGELDQDRVAPSERAVAVRNDLSRARAFGAGHGLEDLPENARVVPIETPPFLHDPLQIWMDAPGPFETRSLDGLLGFATSSPPSGTTLEAVSPPRAFLAVAVLREAFPGRFAQEWWSRQAPTLTQRVLRCRSTCDGWAAWAPVMMIELGYGADDHRLQLAVQVERARADALAIAAIGLHSRRLNLEQASAFLTTEAWMDSAQARRQALLAVRDPGCMAAALGMLQLAHLAEDARKQKTASLPRGGVTRQVTMAVTHQAAMPLRMIRRQIVRGTEAPL